MAVTTSCSACGITIRLGESPDVIARGDRFYHRGCVEVHNEAYRPGTPAYHLPKDW